MNGGTWTKIDCNKLSAQECHMTRRCSARAEGTNYLEMVHHNDRD